MIGTSLGGHFALPFGGHARGTPFSRRFGRAGPPRSDRYLVALARAMLLQRPFLLLDEPFASVPRASLSKVVADTKPREESRNRDGGGIGLPSGVPGRGLPARFRRAPGGWTAAPLDPSFVSRVLARSARVGAQAHPGRAVLKWPRANSWTPFSSEVINARLIRTAVSSRKVRSKPGSYSLTHLKR